MVHIRQRRKEEQQTVFIWVVGILLAAVLLAGAVDIPH